MQGDISTMTPDMYPARPTTSSAGAAANNENPLQAEIAAAGRGIPAGTKGLSQEELDEMLDDPDADDDG
jgi:hypothetical protein